MSIQYNIADHCECGGRSGGYTQGVCGVKINWYLVLATVRSRINLHSRQEVDIDMMVSGRKRLLNYLKMKVKLKA